MQMLGSRGGIAGGHRLKFGGGYGGDGGCISGNGAPRPFLTSSSPLLNQPPTEAAFAPAAASAPPSRGSSRRFHAQHCGGRQRCGAAAAGGSEGASTSGQGGEGSEWRGGGGGTGSAGLHGDAAWWDDLRRGAIGGSAPGSGPGGPASPPRDYGGMAEYLLGSAGYRHLEGIDREERQRQWDAMRAAAWQRFEAGAMPAWFDPDWLMQEEAPLNRMLRLEGNEVYQADDTWLGGVGGSGSGSGSGSGRGSGGWRWWREEDPYWPLRDWGDHPMRWWTFVFAGVLAVGGALGHAVHGSAESLWVGGLAGAALSCAGMAMSDMTDWGHGQLAAKAAWIICATVGAKELLLGWAHRPAPGAHADVVWGRGTGAPARAAGGGGGERWGGCAKACALMCVAYMWTGLSGLDELALPTNPGAVYKSPDVATKHRVWQRWGFGSAAMRT
eukprot:357296-Chlamydomonas_euryale.AAC.5